jgi:8-oxo-dGTP diphosphatase
MIQNFSLILLFDDKKRILLQHRTDDAPRFPGYWGFFGGGIDAGENSETAVRRETLEELEYKLVLPALIMTQKFNSAGLRGTKYIFMEQYDSSKKLVQKEGQGMEWFALDEAAALKMTDDDREVITFVKNNF